MERLALTLQRLENEKVRKSLYFKCFACKEIYHIDEGELLTSHPKIIDKGIKDGKQNTELQMVCEVGCKICLDLLKKSKESIK